jgi:hypothetical protein
LSGKQLAGAYIASAGFFDIVKRKCIRSCDDRGEICGRRRAHQQVDVCLTATFSDASEANGLSIDVSFAFSNECETATAER